MSIKQQLAAEKTVPTAGNVDATLFESASHFGALAGLKLSVLPDSASKCWDYRCEPLIPRLFLGDVAL